MDELKKHVGEQEGGQVDLTGVRRSTSFALETVNSLSLSLC